MVNFLEGFRPFQNDIPVKRINIDYTPSLQAYNFHISPARFRFLIWGVRSGKTSSGVWELLKCALAMPKTLSWIVAPTYLVLQTAERTLIEFISTLDFPLIRNKASHEFYLPNGSCIQCRSADWPENLKGPTIDGMILCDEAAELKERAWQIIRQRIMTTDAEVIFTTTPEGRNWLWKAVLKAGMVPNQGYGDI